MLFSSPYFLFLFLPLTVWLFWRAADVRAHMWLLVIASVVFYGWWNPVYLPLILASIAINYWIGLRIIEYDSRLWLIVGVFFNIILLLLFKYADFFIASINALSGTAIPLLQIAAPLAISIITLQQIAYLVECRRSGQADKDPLSYTLYVLLFPQLNAGSIILHKEVSQQFRTLGRPARPDLFAHGLFLLVIGLFKYVVIADQLAEIADPAFKSPENLLLYDAWVAALACSLEMYFAFSAYSEMAMGIAMLFGIVLPINFNAPYKASNITEFWQRWHITLGRFLRDHVFVPIGGNSSKTIAVLGALMTTMLLCGLWYGPSWTFVAWGALHGFYLVVHQLWRSTGIRLPRVLGAALTFIAVVFAWVLFRADSLDDAWQMWQAMLGLESMAWPTALEYSPIYGSTEALLIVLLLLLVWYAPTVHEVWDKKFKTTLQWSVALACLALVAFTRLGATN